MSYLKYMLDFNTFGNWKYLSITNGLRNYSVNIYFELYGIRIYIYIY